MSLRDQLQTIYDQHGKLTPEIVLDEARDPEHPLHNRFEWRDDVAAEKWRREQARELIVSLKVRYAAPDGTPRDVRSWHAIAREHGHTFEPVEKIGEDPLSSKILLATAEREWRAMRSRYEHLDEFLQMVRRDLGDAA